MKYAVDVLLELADAEEDQWTRCRLLEVAESKRGVLRELYDLRRDPGEQENIIKGERGIARDLEKKLDRWIRSCGYVRRKSGMKS